MGQNFLIDELRNDNPGMFDPDSKTISYKTGFPTLDYHFGYKVNVYGKNNELIETRPEIGIGAGTIVTFIGKPSTGKTTAAVQIASNIIRGFPNGSVIHYDLEEAMNYTRIQILSKFKMQEMKEDGRYILKQDNHSIEEIKQAIIKLYKKKMENIKKISYDTGKLDEFGDPIIIPEPTVIIIDSIASLSVYINEDTKDGAKKLEELTSQPDIMRRAGEISRFINDILKYLKKANITIIFINQIKEKSAMGMPQAADIYYLKQNESLPGGKAPQFYASILVKFIAIGAEKYTVEEHGIDGFGSMLDIIKMRTNQAGRSVHMIYDKVRGFDSLRSSLSFAKEIGVTGGNKNATYFTDMKDTKFPMVTVKEEFTKHPELYTALYSHIIPELTNRLSSVEPEEICIVPEEFMY